MAGRALALIAGSLIVLVTANRRLFERLIAPLLQQQHQFWASRTGLKPQNQRLARAWIFGFGAILLFVGLVSVVALVVRWT